MKSSRRSIFRPLPALALTRAQMLRQLLARVLAITLAAMLELVATAAARAADFVALPQTSMREVVRWGVDAGVSARAWPAIDAAYAAHLARLDALAANEIPLSSLRDSLEERGADLSACERELLRRMDLFLAEEDRFAAELRAALVGAAGARVDAASAVGADATGTNGEMTETLDQAIVLWTARRMLHLVNAVQPPRFYEGVRCPLPDLEPHRERLGLSPDERAAARAALTLQLPALAEKARGFVRARSRVLATDFWSESLDPQESYAAMAPAVEASRNARMALLRAQQAARRAMVAALAPEHREAAAMALLGDAAPGMRYTRVGAIVETIVPYLHELDDRTQRKLGQKVRELRSELARAERRGVDALESAIERGRFEDLMESGNSFQVALDEIAEREGRGISTLIGPRCLEDLVALEMDEYSDPPRAVLGRLMPPGRVDDFLAELATRDPQAAARLAEETPPPGPAKGSLAAAQPLEPGFVDALLQALPATPPGGAPGSLSSGADLPASSRAPGSAEVDAVRAGLQTAARAHQMAWTQRVVPAQQRLRAALAAEPDAAGEMIASLSLRMEPDGRLVVSDPLDFLTARRAALELDQAIAEIDGALLDAVDRLVGPWAPEVALLARMDRAFEVYVERGIGSRLALTASPPSCSALLEATLPDEAEREAALVVAAAEALEAGEPEPVPAGLSLQPAARAASAESAASASTVAPASGFALARSCMSGGHATRS